ncbi:MAG: acylphosphatase [Candidatus Brockarchaeota archaeon]|nr:acylphosphatase [Candidatus Brockarchaeota archaeon]MBO3808779.1 acylphosphatase [Candidatus Brockarchaeota archaeon]
MLKGRIVIKGPRVQDIGYRLFLLNLASEMNLTGFQARNIGNDSVEALYEGGEQEAEGFVDAVKRFAPAEAEVSSIRFEKYEGVVKPIEVFRSEFNTIQLGKIVEVGVKMLGKQDSLLEKQDAMLNKMDSMLKKQDMMLEKQDMMLKKQDMMLEKQDMMLKKQDVVIEKIDGLGVKIDALREDLKSMLDRRLTVLEKDMALVKEKLGIP